MLSVCIFNEIQTVALFLVLDGASTCTNPITSGKKYRKLVYNAGFIHNESLFFVLAAASCAFQFEHTLPLLRSICPTGCEIRTIHQ